MLFEVGAQNKRLNVVFVVEMTVKLPQRYRMANILLFDLATS